MYSASSLFGPEEPRWLHVVKLGAGLLQSSDIVKTNCIVHAGHLEDRHMQRWLVGEVSSSQRRACDDSRYTRHFFRAEAETQEPSL
jgi:hypothetical protein